MVVNLATICGLIVCLFIWGQLLYVWYYAKFLKRSLSIRGDLSSQSDPVQKIPPNFDDCPKVAVILCLRGKDPSLPACLHSLVNQNYPNWSLHLVLDAPNDPALEAVEEFFAERKRPTIHLIKPISEKASLKSQAICTAVNALWKDFDYFAFVDADTRVDLSWLDDLVNPLIHSTSSRGCVATTGNRWFVPDKPKTANYLRQVWNGAAVVQMALYNIAWGGSFAIKRDAIERADLLNRWGEAFCEDTMLSQVLAKHEMKLQRVPHLIVVNEESTNLWDVFRWITRQLITVRLYHPNWRLVQIHALLIFFCSLFVPILAIVSLLLEDITGFGLIAICWFAFQIANYGLLGEVEKRNLAILRQRHQSHLNTFSGKDDQPTSNETQASVSAKSIVDLNGEARDRSFTAYLTAVVLAQIFHPLACWQATFARKVEWRGVEYRILPKGQIELVEYRPLDFSKSLVVSDGRKGI